MLSACAIAEEGVPVTHSHKLSNVYIIVDDQAIDMTNFFIEVDIAGEDAPSAWRLHLNSKDGTISQMSMGMEDGTVDVDASGAMEKVPLSSEDGTIAEIGLTKVDGNYVVHLVSESLGMWTTPSTRRCCWPRSWTRALPASWICCRAWTPPA